MQTKKCLVLGIKRMDNTVNGGARFRLTVLDENDELCEYNTQGDGSRLRNTLSMSVAPQRFMSGGQEGKQYVVAQLGINGRGTVERFDILGTIARAKGKLTGDWGC